MSLDLGSTIDGKYRIVRLLGEGGMGAVFEGENLRIHRKVAIKILHANVAQSSDAVQRFEREAQAAGRIGSDHIVEVLDLGELPDGDRYMVMEFLDGESLSDRIESSGGLSAQKTASLIIDMLDGLHAAHEAGIIHRDLKPDNIFLLTNKGGQADFVKIVDFGISKFSALGGEFSMTQTGAVMGTPYYLSPEQAKGERHVDHLSDLYAVGVMLWETVAGRVPFDGETFNELLFKIVLEPVPELTAAKPETDPHFVAIVQKAMARDRSLRFQSAQELQGALRSWLEGQPPAPEMLADAQEARITRTDIYAPVTQAKSEAMAATALPAGSENATTKGNWANTQVPQGRAGSSKKWLLIGGIGVAAAASFGMFLSQQNAAAEAQATAQAEAEAEADRVRQVAAESATELAQLEAQKAKAEAERAQADRARLEAEKRQAVAQLGAAEQARKAREDEEEERLAAARAQAIRRAQRTSPRSSSKPAPAKPAASAGGRVIRNEL